MSVFPTLRTLRFELEERRERGALAETAHARPIVVSRAPALFFFSCQDPSCKDGGHDLTAVVCASLRAGKERFEGEDQCRGQTGTAECGRMLRFVATATYSS